MNSKEQKKKWNQTYREKKKRNKMLGEVKEEVEPSMEHHREEVVVEPPMEHHREEVVVEPSEAEEVEISYEDYQEYMKWKSLKTDIDIIKKKDPNWVMTIMKTVGVGLLPALIGVVQRAALATVEQRTAGVEARIPTPARPSTIPGSGRVDPFSPEQLLMQHS